MKMEPTKPTNPELLAEAYKSLTEQYEFTNPFAKKLKQIRKASGMVCQTCDNELYPQPPLGTIQKYCAKRCRTRRTKKGRKKC